MSKKRYHFAIATQLDFLNPENPDWYVQQVLKEDQLLIEALKKRNCTAVRSAWDSDEFDWSLAEHVVVRATWNYSSRIEQYSSWLNRVSKLSQLVNPLETILWNLDKNYLLDLESQGISIPPTRLVEKVTSTSFLALTDELGWDELVITPAVSGGGRHTFRIQKEKAKDYDPTFQKLVQSESMILQEFQHNILTKGEITLVCFGGKYSHAIRKFAKEGEFRVQDDFGGRVEVYMPNQLEIEYAERAMQAIESTPTYGRVDMIWNNQDELCISELELIEPELWLRFEQSSAEMFADALTKSNA